MAKTDKEGMDQLRQRRVEAVAALHPDKVVVYWNTQGRRPCWTLAARGDGWARAVDFGDDQEAAEQVRDQLTKS